MNNILLYFSKMLTKNYTLRIKIIVKNVKLVNKCTIRLNYTKTC